jgi:pimeloyl-ACP methyl ester carboxylesterase
MSFRRSATLALAAAALVSGCKEVSQEASTSEMIVAAYASPLVPSPNDVALASAPKLPAGAQRALLQAFVKGGGFPSDQAVAITVPFVRYQLDSSGASYAPSPAVLDPATITSATFALRRVDGGTTDVAWEIDPQNSTTAQDGKSWTLTIRRPVTAGNRRWPTGRYVFAVRGGPSGVKTTDGKAVIPDSAVSLALAAGASGNLSNPQNVPIGTPDDKRALLETVRKTLYFPLDWAPATDPVLVTSIWNAAPSGSVAPAFTAVNGVFPASELVSFATFEIAPQVTATIPVDSGSGIAPLPIDLLRTGPVTLASGGQKTIAFNAAFGPAAQGLTTLNGFSTTAMILAPGIGTPLDAGSVTGASVQLYRLPPGGAPVLLKEFKQELGLFQATGGAQGRPDQAAYVAEPTPLTTTTGCPVTACSTVVGLQPAAQIQLPGMNFVVPPLDEETDYAVVITTGVKDAAGRPLQRSSMVKILVDPGFDPIATSTADTGIALLPGMPAASANSTAIALATMRAQLSPVMTARGRTDDVVVAWTFRTQSVKGATVTLAALPYLPSSDPRVGGVQVGVANGDPEAVVTFSPAVAAGQHGVPAALLPDAAFTEIAEVKLRTVNMQLGAAGLAANSGFMDPLHPTTEVVTALVAVPARGLVTGSCPAGGPFGTAYADAAVTNCAPLVVYEHGIAQSKTHMLPLAAALAAKGFIVAAIDQMMQGDRSFCSGSGADLTAAQAAADQMCCPALVCGAADATTCAFKANLSTSVDVDSLGRPIHIGVCETSLGARGRPLAHRYDSGSTPSLKGIAFASGNRLLSFNFFRLRDAFRQDAVDQSALVKALAPVGPGTDDFAAHLRAYGIAVDPTRIYWVGHSGGAINGAMTLAVNPRVTRGVAYAPGATFVDIAANPASSFHSTLIGLLPPTIPEGSSAYLQLLQTAKWVLDPSDPANYAPYVTGAVKPILASPLTASFPVASREVLTQLSLCDGTVPNTQNLLYAGLLGLAPPATPGTTASGRVQWFMKSGAATCPADAATHGNIIDYATPTLTAQAQSTIAAFLASPADMTTPVLP